MEQTKIGVLRAGRRQELPMPVESSIEIPMFLALSGDFEPFNCMSGDQAARYGYADESRTIE